MPLSAEVDLSSGFTVSAWIWPTLPAKGGTIVGCRSSGFALGLEDGRVCLRLGDRVWTVGEPLPARRWAFVAATSRGLFVASEEPYTSHALVGEPFEAGPLSLSGQLVLGEGFNGKIDRPRLFGRALDGRGASDGN